MFVVIRNNPKRFSFPEIRAESQWLYCHMFRLFVCNATKPEGTGQHSRYGDWATDWTVRGSNPAWCKRFSSSPKFPDRLCGPHSLLFSCYLDYLSGVKRPGHDVNHLTPSSAEFKNEWSHNFTIPICCHGVNVTCNTTKLVFRYVM